MARISLTGDEGKIPKRIDNYVIYKLDDALIIRANSGFTSSELKNHPKYANCRKNASEFGRISKTGKAIRILLADLLPKESNLALVNQLTKKLRTLLDFDSIHAKGERILQEALLHTNARTTLRFYDFNPSGIFYLTNKENDLYIGFEASSYKQNDNSVGMRWHTMHFDFETLTGVVNSEVWQIELVQSHEMALQLPEIKSALEGVTFSILEVQFFRAEEGSLLPDALGVKSVFIVDYTF